MAKDGRRTDLVEAINCFKNRNIRLFKDTVRALYGEDPYILSPLIENSSLSLVFRKI